MSLYTTEVRYICEMASGYNIEDLRENKYTPEQIIDKSWKKVLNFPWTFYNSEWKEKIGKFFLKYYYTREIGLETAALWKLKVNTRIEEIRGTYEPMIEALEKITAEDLFNNYSFTGYNDRTDNLTDKRTDNLTSKRTDNLTATQNSDSKDRFSDTPQNGLGPAENNNYLTEYRNITDNGTVKNTGDQTNKQTGDQTTAHTGTQKTQYGESGTRGISKAEALARLEADKLNLLQRIIYEFDDLFFKLWQ